MSRQEDFFNEATKQIRDSYVFQNDETYSDDDVRDIATSLAEYGYQYAVDKAFDILSQMLYTKRDDEHPAQHYTRSVESMGEFVSQTDFLNQFKQKMQ